jgi:hypothetical protein
MKQQLALFNLETATKQLAVDNRSVPLFRSNKSEDLQALGLKAPSDLRAELKAQGLKGNALSNAVRQSFFEQLGAANVRAKTVEAAFEESGAKVTTQRLSVSKNGTVHLNTRRSKMVAATPEMKIAQLETQIKKLKQEASTVTIS